MFNAVGLGVPTRHCASRCRHVVLAPVGSPLRKVPRAGTVVRNEQCIGADA